jgi:hypothetical protein
MTGDAAIETMDLLPFLGALGPAMMLVRDAFTASHFIVMRFAQTLGRVGVMATLD